MGVPAFVACGECALSDKNSDAESETDDNSKNQSLKLCSPNSNFIRNESDHFVNNAYEI